MASAITASILNASYIDIDPSQMDAGYNSSDIIYLVIFYTLLLAVALCNVCGNILLISSFVFIWKLRAPCCLLISLALGDLIFGAFYTVYNLISEFASCTWEACIFVLTTMQIGALASSYSLVAVTINRFVSVIFPLRHQQIITIRIVLISIVLIWIWSTSWALGLFVGINAENFSGVCDYRRYTQIWHDHLQSIISFGVPWIIMVTLYAQIAVIAKKQAKVIAGQERDEEERDRMLRKMEWKLTKTIGVILSVYVLAWIPILVILYVTILLPGLTVNRYIWGAGRILLLSNYSFNFVIYAIRHKELRENLKTILRKMALHRKYSGNER